ncbi:anti-sigma factor antagonist [Streptomyces corynorhini]|uniref:Anti-sigma factor antagonist n=1 Tax=Streptomyces corynorhini TaxID=2282652 RepID=A0A370B691_9ACTN|nr:anti-sigma factor antagonist [Streptomyces corynorhini]
MVVAVSGDLDIENITPLGTALAEAGASVTGPVVVDLSRVDFADSTTVNLLLRAHGSLGPRLRLAQPSAFVQRLFAVIGLEQAFPVYGTVEDALAADGGGERRVAGDEGAARGEGSHGGG